MSSVDKGYLKQKLQKEKEIIEKITEDKEKKDKMKKTMTAEDKKKKKEMLKDRRIQTHLRRKQLEEANAPAETKKQDFEMLEEITLERTKRKADKIQKKITDQEKTAEEFKVREGDDEETKAKKEKAKKNHEEQIANEGEDNTDCSSSMSTQSDFDMHVSPLTPATQTAHANTSHPVEATQGREGETPESVPPRDPRVRGVREKGQGESTETVQAPSPLPSEAAAIAIPPSNTNTPVKKKGRKGPADNDEENDEDMTQHSGTEDASLKRDLSKEEDIPNGQSTPKDNSRGRSTARSPRSISTTQSWADQVEQEDQTNRGAEERSREKRNRPRQRRKHDEQVDLEEHIGIKFSDLKWTIKDMRILDRASVDRGFCPITGFDIDRLKGYDGYTGMIWNERYPFIKSKFERLLAEEEAKAKDRKEQGREGIDIESRADRLGRINRDANARREHYIDVVGDGEFDTSEPDSDTALRTREIEEVRKMNYNDSNLLPGSLVTQLKEEENEFQKRESKLKREEDKYQQQGESAQAQHCSQERAKIRKERRKWKKTNLRGISHRAFNYPKGGAAMKLKVALKTQVLDWIYTSDSEDSSLERTTMWAKTVEHYQKHKATVAPGILAEITLPLTLPKEKRNQLKEELTKEIYNIKGGSERAARVGEIVWECKKHKNDIPIEIAKQICGERELHEAALKYVADKEQKEDKESLKAELRQQGRGERHLELTKAEASKTSEQSYHSSIPHWTSRATADNCRKGFTPDELPGNKEEKTSKFSIAGTQSAQLRQRIHSLK